MVNVIGVKFDKSPKIYNFEAGEHNYDENSRVLVETARGLEIGLVVNPPAQMDEKRIPAPLKPVIRIATEADIAQYNHLKEKKAQALKAATDIINTSGLEMKLIDAEYMFDGSRLIFYFTANERIDFRDLVRDLASTFKVRIELRQIGTRDECKLKGGLGPCGRACCCCAHLNEFSQVTIKMAKNQSLSLNPSKISGLCGRLMCCLSYENAHYAETNKKMPKLGCDAETDDGKRGTVTAINQIKETVTLKIYDKDIYTFNEYPLVQIKKVFAKGDKGAKNLPQNE